jgi:hypothetical protein
VRSSDAPSQCRASAYALDKRPQLVERHCRELYS